MYSYHLKITPEIPEDSRQLRQMIVFSIQDKIKEHLEGDFYTSGMIVFGNKKIEDLLTYETVVNKTKFAVAMNYDT